MLCQLRSVRHLLIGDGQHDRSVVSIQSRDEELRQERADLLGREVHDADDLPTDQLALRVESGDLRTGLLDANLRAEVRLDLVGWLAGLGEVLDRQDRADSKFHSLEV